MLGIAQVEHRVALLDGLQRLEDGVAQVGEAVGDHPLDLADPDDDAGQLGRVGVKLDAEHCLGADLGELHRDVHRQRRPEDGLTLQVLERLQGEVEEVARATCGIEHAHGTQAVQKGVEDRHWVLVGRGARRDRLALATSASTRAFVASKSRRSGVSSTGSMRRMMEARSV